MTSKKLLAWLCIGLLSFGSIFEVPLTSAVSTREADIAHEDIVSLVVEEGIWKSMSTDIEKYARRIQSQLPSTKTVILTFPRDAHPYTIAQTIESLYFNGIPGHGKTYQKLVGTILIGHIPIPVVHKDDTFFLSLYPYTDFDEPHFYFDTTTNRYEFIDDNRRNSSPDIWHSVIDPNSGDAKLDQTKIREFFTRVYEYDAKNNRYANIGSDPQVLHLDTIHETQSISPMMLSIYEKLTLPLQEHILAHRYTRDFAKYILTKYNELLESDGQSVVEPYADWKTKTTDATAMLDQTNDIATKNLVDQFLPNFLKTLSDTYITNLASAIGNSGRYASPNTVQTRFDTIPSLISAKDELTGLLLIQGNRALQELVNTTIDTQLSLDIPLLQKQEITKTITGTTTIDGKEQKYSKTVDFTFTNYIFGKKATDIKEAQECSLFVGSRFGGRTTSAELNRGYDITVTESDSAKLAEDADNKITCDNLVNAYWGGNSPLNLTVSATDSVLGTHRYDSILAPLRDTTAAKTATGRASPFDCLRSNLLLEPYRITSDSDKVLTAWPSETKGKSYSCATKFSSSTPSPVSLDPSLTENSSNLLKEITSCSGKGGIELLGRDGSSLTRCEAGTLTGTYRRIPSLVPHASPTDAIYGGQLTRMTSPNLPVDEETSVSYIARDGTEKELVYPNLFDIRVQGTDTDEDIIAKIRTAFAPIQAQLDTRTTIADDHPWRALIPATSSQSPKLVDTLLADAQIRTGMLSALRWRTLDITAKYSHVLAIALQPGTARDNIALPGKKSQYEIAYIGGFGDAQNMYLGFTPHDETSTPPSYQKISTTQAQATADYQWKESDDSASLVADAFLDAPSSSSKTSFGGGLSGLDFGALLGGIGGSLIGGMNKQDILGSIGSGGKQGQLGTTTTSAQVGSGQYASENRIPSEVAVEKTFSPTATAASSAEKPPEPAKLSSNAQSCSGMNTITTMGYDSALQCWINSTSKTEWYTPTIDMSYPPMPQYTNVSQASPAFGSSLPLRSIGQNDANANGLNDFVERNPSSLQMKNSFSSNTLEPRQIVSIGSILTDGVTRIGDSVSRVALNITRIDDLTTKQSFTTKLANFSAIVGQYLTLNGSKTMNDGQASWIATSNSDHQVRFSVQSSLTDGTTPLISSKTESLFAGTNPLSLALVTDATLPTGTISADTQSGITIQLIGPDTLPQAAHVSILLDGGVNPTVDIPSAPITGRTIVLTSPTIDGAIRKIGKYTIQVELEEGSARTGLTIVAGKAAKLLVKGDKVLLKDAPTSYSATIQDAWGNTIAPENWSFMIESTIPVIATPIASSASQKIQGAFASIFSIAPTKNGGLQMTFTTSKGSETLTAFVSSTVINEARILVTTPESMLPCEAIDQSLCKIEAQNIDYEILRQVPLTLTLINANGDTIETWDPTIRVRIKGADSTINTEIVTFVNGKAQLTLNTGTIPGDAQLYVENTQFGNNLGDPFHIIAGSPFRLTLATPDTIYAKKNTEFTATLTVADVRNNPTTLRGASIHMVTDSPELVTSDFALTEVRPGVFTTRVTSTGNPGRVLLRAWLEKDGKKLTSTLAEDVATPRALPVITTEDAAKNSWQNITQVLLGGPFGQTPIAGYFGGATLFSPSTLTLAISTNIDAPRTPIFFITPGGNIGLTKKPSNLDNGVGPEILSYKNRILTIAVTDPTRGPVAEVTYPALPRELRNSPCQNCEKDTVWYFTPSEEGVTYENGGIIYDNKRLFTLEEAFSFPSVSTVLVASDRDDLEYTIAYKGIVLGTATLRLASDSPKPTISLHDARLGIGFAWTGMSSYEVPSQVVYDPSVTTDTYDTEHPNSWSSYPTNDLIGWKGENTAMLDFASRAGWGEAMQRNADYTLVNLGDPIIRLPEFGLTNTGFDTTPGIPVYTSSRDIASIALGEINNDAKKDLLVVHTDGTIGTSLNRGEGRIADFADLFSLPFAREGLVQTGDFFGDGYTDIIYIDTLGSWHVINFTASGPRDMSPPFGGSTPSGAPIDFVVFDMDHDGRDDVVILEKNGVLTIQYGNADATFTYQDIDNAANLAIQTDPSSEYFTGAIHYTGPGFREPSTLLKNATKTSEARTIKTVNEDIFTKVDIPKLGEKNPVKTAFLESSFIDTDSIGITKSYTPIDETTPLTRGSQISIDIALTNHSSKSLKDIILLERVAPFLTKVDSTYTLQNGSKQTINTFSTDDGQTKIADLAGTTLPAGDTLHIIYTAKLADVTYGKLAVGLLESSDDISPSTSLPRETIVTMDTEIAKSTEIPSSIIYGEDLFGDIRFSTQGDCGGVTLFWRSHNTVPRTYHKSQTFPNAGTITGASPDTSSSTTSKGTTSSSTGSSSSSNTGSSSSSGSDMNSFYTAAMATTAGLALGNLLMNLGSSSRTPGSVQMSNASLAGLGTIFSSIPASNAGALGQRELSAASLSGLSTILPSISAAGTSMTSGLTPQTKMALGAALGNIAVSAGSGTKEISTLALGGLGSALLTSLPRMGTGATPLQNLGNSTLASLGNVMAMMPMLASSGMDPSAIAKTALGGVGTMMVANLASGIGSQIAQSIGTQTLGAVSGIMSAVPLFTTPGAAVQLLTNTALGAIAPLMTSASIIGSSNLLPLAASSMTNLINLSTLANGIPNIFNAGANLFNSIGSGGLLQLGLNATGLSQMMNGILGNIGNQLGMSLCHFSGVNPAGVQNQTFGVPGSHSVQQGFNTQGETCHKSVLCGTPIFASPTGKDRKSTFPPEPEGAGGTVGEKKPVPKEQKATEKETEYDENWEDDTTGDAGTGEGSGAPSAAAGSASVKIPESSVLQSNTIPPEHIGLDTDGKTPPPFDDSSYSKDGMTSYPNLDATKDYYVVVPMGSSIPLGTQVLVESLTTGKKFCAIVGDYGPTINPLGEISLKLAKDLGEWDGHLTDKSIKNDGNSAKQKSTLKMTFLKKGSEIPPGMCDKATTPDITDSPFEGGKGISNYRHYVATTTTGAVANVYCYGPNNASNPSINSPGKYPFPFFGNCIYQVVNNSCAIGGGIPGLLSALPFSLLGLLGGGGGSGGGSGSGSSGTGSGASKTLSTNSSSTQIPKDNECINNTPVPSAESAKELTKSSSDYIANPTKENAKSLQSAVSGRSLNTVRSALDAPLGVATSKVINQIQRVEQVAGTVYQAQALAKNVIGAVNNVRSTGSNMGTYLGSTKISAPSALRPVAEVSPVSSSTSIPKALRPVAEVSPVVSAPSALRPIAEVSPVTSSTSIPKALVPIAEVSPVSGAPSALRPIAEVSPVSGAPSALRPIAEVSPALGPLAGVSDLGRGLGGITTGIASVPGTIIGGVTSGINSVTSAIGGTINAGINSVTGAVGGTINSVTGAIGGGIQNIAQIAQTPAALLSGAANAITTGSAIAQTAGALMNNPKQAALGLTMTMLPPGVLGILGIMNQQNLTFIPGFPNYTDGHRTQQNDQVVHLYHSPTLTVMFPVVKKSDYDPRWESTSPASSTTPSSLGSAATQPNSLISSSLNFLNIFKNLRSTSINPATMTGGAGTPGGTAVGASGAGGDTGSPLVGPSQNIIRYLNQLPNVHTYSVPIKAVIYYPGKENIDNWLAGAQNSIGQWSGSASDQKTEMIGRINEDIAIVNTYRDVPEQLQRFNYLKEKYLFQTLKNVEAAQNLLPGWLKANQSGFEAWAQSHDDAERKLAQWQLINDMFNQFEQQCGLYGNQRDGINHWTNVITDMGVPKYPVIPYPYSPNIEYAMSGLDFSINIPVPEFEFTFQPKPLPSIPDPGNITDLDSALPLLARYPDLSGANIDIKVDPIKLPVLPPLPPSPTLPTPLLGGIVPTMAQWAEILKAQCLKNKDPRIPEYMLAAALSDLIGLPKQYKLSDMTTDVSTPAPADTRVDTKRIEIFVTLADYPKHVEPIFAQFRQMIEPFTTIPAIDVGSASSPASSPIPGDSLGAKSMSSLAVSSPRTVLAMTQEDTSSVTPGSISVKVESLQSSAVTESAPPLAETATPSITSESGTSSSSVGTTPKTKIPPYIVVDYDGDGDNDFMYANDTTVYLKINYSKKPAYTYFTDAPRVFDASQIARDFFGRDTLDPQYITSYGQLYPVGAQQYGAITPQYFLKSDRDHIVLDLARSPIPTSALENAGRVDIIGPSALPASSDGLKPSYDLARLSAITGEVTIDHKQFEKIITPQDAPYTLSRETIGYTQESTKLDLIRSEKLEQITMRGGQEFHFTAGDSVTVTSGLLQIFGSVSEKRTLVTEDKNLALQPGDRVIAGTGGGATITLRDDSKIHLGPNQFWTYLTSSGVGLTHSETLETGSGWYYGSYRAPKIHPDDLRFVRPAFFDTWSDTIRRDPISRIPEKIELPIGTPTEVDFQSYFPYDKIERIVVSSIDASFITSLGPTKFSITADTFYHDITLDVTTLQGTKTFKTTITPLLPTMTLDTINTQYISGKISTIPPATTIGLHTFIDDRTFPVVNEIAPTIGAFDVTLPDRLATFYFSTSSGDILTINRITSEPTISASPRVTAGEYLEYTLPGDKNSLRIQYRSNGMAYRQVASKDEIHSNGIFIIGSGLRMEPATITDTTLPGGVYITDTSYKPLLALDSSGVVRYLSAKISFTLAFEGGLVTYTIKKDDTELGKLILKGEMITAYDGK